MGFEDRPYYRDRPSSTGFGGVLDWIMNGSVPLFTAFGIRVRMHSSLVLFIALVILIGSRGFGLADRLTSMAVLFGIVLLHEFGHCFAARHVGGTAEDIMMTPLGGLAFARAPHAPWPQFVTVAGGPLVNVAICLICGIALFFMTGGLVPLNPFNPMPPESFYVTSAPFYLWWVFSISYILLLFNLLPIFPLDGGQLLQALLWPRFGYYKSMMFACVTGMGGAVMLGLFGLFYGGLLLVFIAIMGFMTCLQQRRALLAAGPHAFYEQEDFSASLYNKPRKGPGRWAESRARRKVQAERIEQQKIDAILAKVSSKGMHSLSWWEKRTLKHATERQQKADAARVQRYTR